MSYELGVRPGSVLASRHGHGLVESRGDPRHWLNWRAGRHRLAVNRRAFLTTVSAMALARVVRASDLPDDLRITRAVAFDLPCRRSKLAGKGDAGPGRLVLGNRGKTFLESFLFGVVKGSATATARTVAVRTNCDLAW